MSNNTNSESTTTASAVPLPGHWTLDDKRSTVAFRQKGTWGLGTVKGAFRSVSGSGEVLADGTGHGTLTIEAKSINTKNPMRDFDLRTNFFQVKKHPQITYTVHRATREADGRVAFTGALTVRGNTQPVAFTARATESAANAVTLAAEVVVDRKSFISWNPMGMLRGDTTVTLALRFTRQP